MASQMTSVVHVTKELPVQSSHVANPRDNVELPHLVLVWTDKYISRYLAVIKSGSICFSAVHCFNDCDLPLTRNSICVSHCFD